MNPAPVSHVFVDVDAHVDQAELERIAPGLQEQLRADLAPAWSLPPLDVVRADSHVTPPADGEVEIQLIAEPPPAEDGDLGVHDKKPDGTPIIRVYVELAKRCGVSLSSVVSHELCEARIDPEGDTTATLPDGRVVAVEVCDQVEALSYENNGVEVSDFNTPSNFGIRGNEPPYDQMGRQSLQFTVLEGGYAQVLTDGGWQQLTTETGMRAYRAELDRRGLSRAARRRKRRQQREAGK